jgi:pSer/pThr/pTyr-binding forkhead associated (FHA) protein
VKVFSVRSAQSSDQRRRRLRLIKAVDDRLARRVQSAQLPLSVPPNDKVTRRKFKVHREKLFRECSGNPATTLLIERDGQPPTRVTMDRPFLLIGRDSSCDLQLNDEAVNPRHCFLHWIDGNIFCCDVAHRTTFFPDRQPQPNGRWVSQQPISIGPYQLRRLDDGNSSSPDFSPLDRSPRLAAEFPLLGLEFEGIEQVENVWPVNRVLTLIGRGPQCKLRLNHKSIAYVHACLVRTQSGCWLVDLAKENTTGVNDQAIRIAALDVGDIIRLGSFPITVVTTDTSSVLPFEQDSALRDQEVGKSLPPIRLDRQPKGTPPNSALPLLKDRPRIEMPMPAPPKSIPAVDGIGFVTPSIPTSGVIASPALVVPSTTAMIGVDVRSVVKPAAIKIQPGKIPATNAVDGGVRTIRQSNRHQSDTDLPAPLVNENAVSNEAIAGFIEQQKSQLVALKSRLKQLQQVYNDAAGKMISMKTKEALEKPVLETMQTYKAMEELLEQFIQTHDRQD